jgi:hypothetical protein
MKPEFSSKGARDEQVINYLLPVTKGVAGRMRETMACQLIRGPASIMASNYMKK